MEGTGATCQPLPTSTWPGHRTWLAISFSWHLLPRSPLQAARAGPSLDLCSCFCFTLCQNSNPSASRQEAIQNILPGPWIYKDKIPSVAGFSSAELHKGNSEVQEAPCTYPTQTEMLPSDNEAPKTVKRQRERENFAPCCSLKLSKEIWKHWALIANLVMEMQL